MNPGPFLELHLEDAVVLDVREGDPVRVTSRQGWAELPARPTEDIRPGCCWSPMHWNDLFGPSIAINQVTSERACPVSHQPELKFCPVRLEAAVAPEPSFLINPAYVHA
jgi:sulfite reductase (NADPH) flavoprotein alpha-component